MYKRIRLIPEIRKKQILDAGLMEASEKGLYNFSIINVSRRLGNCSKSLIKEYFKSLTGLQTEVIKHALNIENNHVIGQAIALNHKTVKHIKQKDPARYLQGLI